jgi:hypothetical protein
LTPSSFSYRVSHYPVPKREVKEEYETPTQQRRRVSGGGIGIHEPDARSSAGLLVGKLEVKEEEDEDEVAALLRRWHLVASSDDPDDM